MYSNQIRGAARHKGVILYENHTKNGGTLYETIPCQPNRGCNDCWIKKEETNYYHIS
jgi:hypothetical protein